MDETERLNSAIATMRIIADRLEVLDDAKYEQFVLKQNADLYEGVIGTIGHRHSRLIAS